MTWQTLTYLNQNAPQRVRFNYRKIAKNEVSSQFVECLLSNQRPNSKLSNIPL
jgi:hypothetical protein